MVTMQSRPPRRYRSSLRDGQGRRTRQRGLDAAAAVFLDRGYGAGTLRAGWSNEEAVDTVWLLMDPVIFDRLSRRRKWTLEQYERWFARSVARLLTADAPRQGDEPPARRGARSTERRKG